LKFSVIFLSVGNSIQIQSNEFRRAHVIL